MKETANAFVEFCDHLRRTDLAFLVDDLDDLYKLSGTLQGENILVHELLLLLFFFAVDLTSFEPERRKENFNTFLP